MRVRMTPTREEALHRVLAYRKRGRQRRIGVRGLLAILGSVLLVVSLPLSVVLPEGGVPAMLVALRLLAVEAMWAARAYASVDWRFHQACDWFHRQSRPIKAAVVVGLLLILAALVWLIINELS